MDPQEDKEGTWLHQQAAQLEQQTRRHQELETKYREQTQHLEELLQVQERANELFRKSAEAQQRQYALVMEMLSAHEVQLIALAERIKVLEQGAE